jgi:hypothetical protein
MLIKIGSARPKIMVNFCEHGVAVVLFSWHRLYAFSLGPTRAACGINIKKYAKKAN